MSLLGWLRRSSRNPKSTKECSLIFEITTDRQGVKNMLIEPGTSAKAMILMMEGLLSDAGVCISRYKASEEVYLVTQEERTPYHYALCGTSPPTRLWTWLKKSGQSSESKAVALG